MQTKIILTMDTNDAKGGSHSQKAIVIMDHYLAPDDIDLAMNHGNFASKLANRADVSEAKKHMTITNSVWR
jgi:hypothetical protein